MRKLISAGVANFEAIRSGDRFYIDKTQFIADWWHDGAQATLIARPRRFGKSLMLSAIEHFFSPNCRNQETLFADLDVWQDEELRALAGTIPVISLSFSGIKGNTAEMALEALVGVVFSALEQFRYLESSERLSPQMRARFAAFSFSTRGAELTFAIQNLCQAIWLHHGVRPIVLLDEYDTPLQEAWLQGYWDALIPMMREFMNLTFKSNNYLERAILTGITRVSKESIFSDLNNLTVVTTTSPLYETSFGFTEAEVFQAMDDFGRRDREGVKFWYDGFTFGEQRDIYNPWSIASYLKYGTLRTYWANTSSNALVSSEVRRGNPRIKTDFEALLRGDCIEANIKEELSFRDLTGAANALWSLLLASGYLAIDSPVADNRYRLRLTNYEVLKSMQDLVAQWFEDSAPSDYDGFFQAFLHNNLPEMNRAMNRILGTALSYFDVQGRDPEKFYHGFVLGMMVRFSGRFVVRSNRESGLGRYDVMLEPVDKKADDGFVLEFKVNTEHGNPEDVLQEAKAQILSKDYALELIDRGVPPERIRTYGFVFEGKSVLIG